MKKILAIGYSLDRTAQEVHSGRLPSHFLYGLWELDRSMYKIDYYSYANRHCANRGFFHDIYHIFHSKPDIIYIPYFEANILLLFFLFLKLLRLTHLPIVCIMHSTLKMKWFYPVLFRKIDMMLFHSPKNRNEYLEGNCTQLSKTRVIKWGIDIDFYNKIPSGKKEMCFISSGIENRDYKLILNINYELAKLISIFLSGKTPEQERESLEKQNINKIKITYVKQDHNIFKYLIKASKASYAYLIPIKNEALHYCVGHTSMVEALALGKPILVTANPYHPIDVEKEGVGIKVYTNTSQGWSDAVKYLVEHPEEAKEMSQKAYKLAQEEYNIHRYSSQLSTLFNSISI